MIDAITHQKATRRQWIALSILVLPTLLVSMDMTVTYLALPVLSAALKPTSSELLWITDIFGFFEAGLLIVMGSLGDRVGIKKMLLLGATAFTAASVFAAFAPSAFWLIVARAVMGIAGAAILPTVLSLIRNMFHNDTERTFAMGLYTTCFSSGTMLGPIIGGFLLSHFWWGSIFLMPVPLILILLAAAPALLPEFKDHRAKSIDLLSSALLILGTLAAIFGIKQIAQNGPGALPVLVVVAGVLVGVFFVKRQQKLQHPLIDLELFKIKGFFIALTALFIGLFSWAGIFLFVGQYLQSVIGISAFAAGLWMLPGALGSVLLCMLAPVAIKYFSRGRVITFGLTVLAAGIFLLCLLTTHSLWLLVVCSFMISGGCGLTVTLGIDKVVASAPPNKAGAAAGISETSTTFGASLGVALLGCIWTAFYRNDISTTIPTGLSAHQIETVKNTIGSAVVQAKNLHNQALLSLAKQAFVHALHITAFFSALAVVVVAVLVAVKFKDKTVVAIG